MKKRHGRPVDTTAKEGYWGDLWVLQKKRGMVIVGETCKYHNRGEEYGVILERPGVPQQTGGKWC